MSEDESRMEGGSKINLKYIIKYDDNQINNLSGGSIITSKLKYMLVEHNTNQSNNISNLIGKFNSNLNI